MIPKTYVFAARGLAQHFGGMLPARWGIFIDHNTVAALKATAGNHELRYTGLKLQSS